MDTLTVHQNENIPNGIIIANRATARWIARTMNMELEESE